MAGWGRTSGRALPSGRAFFHHGLLGGGRPHPGLVAAVDRRGNTLRPLSRLLGLCSYVLLYTALLNPGTTQNIVIGGVAGAIAAWWERARCQWACGSGWLVAVQPGDALDTGPFLGLGPVACGGLPLGGHSMLPVIKGAAQHHPGDRPLRQGHGP